MRMARDAGLESDATRPLSTTDWRTSPSSGRSGRRRRRPRHGNRGRAQRVPEAEMARILAACNRRHARQSAHPIARSAHGARLNHTWCPRCASPAARRGWRCLALAGLDRMDRFARYIAVKSHRAVGALILMTMTRRNHESDPEFKASDGNQGVCQAGPPGHRRVARGLAPADAGGCRLGRRHPGRDGPSPRRAGRGAETGFPRAMDFVRAGFDE